MSSDQRIVGEVGKVQENRKIRCLAFHNSTIDKEYQYFCCGDYNEEARCIKYQRCMWEAEPTLYIRGHELPMNIVTFDDLTLEYGHLGL